MATGFGPIEEGFLKLRGGTSIVQPSAEEVVIQSSAKTKVVIRGRGSDAVVVLGRLLNGGFLPDVIRGVPYGEQIVSFLQSTGLFLRPGATEIDPAELERFDRLIGLLAHYESPTTTRFELFARLRRATVLFIGLGSLGASILQHVLGHGIGTVIGVDPDIVEASNLSRQSFYGDDDVGLKKIAAADRRISNSSTYTSFIGCDARVRASRDVQELLDRYGPVNAVVLTADEPPWQITDWVTLAARAASVPLIRVNRYGVGPFYVPHQTSCPGCDRAELAQTFGSVAEARAQIELVPRSYQPASSIVIGLLASLAARELAAFVSGAGNVHTLGHRLTVNSSNAVPIDVRAVPRWELCELCNK